MNIMRNPKFAILGAVIFVLLLTGFVVLFFNFHWRRELRKFLESTRKLMDGKNRARLLARRQALVDCEEHVTWDGRIERSLKYSGLKNRYPFLTAERVVAANLLIGLCLTPLILVGFRVYLCGLGAFFGLEYLLVDRLKARNFKAVNDELLKLLDLCGNYGASSGEITGILGQVGRYLAEPLNSALLECCSEAKLTGDTGMALLALADSIEHPQFKLFIRNLEIGSRYCADIRIIVVNSRKTLREYLKHSAEQKSMLREAALNMIILLVMAFFSVFLVNGMIQVSMWTIIFATPVGNGAMAVVLLMIFLFLRQVRLRR